MTSLAALLTGRSLMIFDFDGTVADTSPLHAAAFTEVLAPYGIAVDYPQIAGMKTADAMARCIADAGRDAKSLPMAELVAEKQRLVRAAIAEGLEPLPGVDRFLRWLRPQYRLAMATSGSRGTVELALARIGYSDWFSPFVCADDLHHAKPHPEAFLTVLERAGVKPGQALVFEDSHSGFAAAAAAGIACVDARSNLWDQLHGFAA